MMNLELNENEVEFEFEVNKNFFHIPLIDNYKEYIKKIVNDKSRIIIITITEMPYINKFMDIIESNLFISNKKFYKFYFNWKNIKWSLSSYPYKYIKKIEKIAKEIDFRLIKGIMPVEVLQYNPDNDEHFSFQTPNNMFPIKGDNVYSVTYTYSGFLKYNPSVELLENCIENIIN